MTARVELLAGGMAARMQVGANLDDFIEVYAAPASRVSVTFTDRDGLRIGVNGEVPGAIERARALTAELGGPVAEDLWSALGACHLVLERPFTSDAEIVLALDTGGGPEEITLGDFRAANVAEDGDDYFDSMHAGFLRALAVGEAYEGNEGAGGTWTVTRVR